MKPAIARQAAFKTLKDNVPDFFTARDVFDALRANNPDMSIGTIRRALQHLRRRGLIARSTTHRRLVEKHGGPWMKKVYSWWFGLFIHNATRRYAYITPAGRSMAQRQKRHSRRLTPMEGGAAK